MRTRGTGFGFRCGQRYGVEAIDAINHEGQPAAGELPAPLDSRPTNTGGGWRITLVDSTAVAVGDVPATFSYAMPDVVVYLTLYRSVSQLKVAVPVRRTAGVTTGGRQGDGGAIGYSLRYARLP